MFTYMIETKKSIKEIFSGLPLRNLVELQQNVTSIVDISNGDVKKVGLKNESDLISES